MSIYVLATGVALLLGGLGSFYYASKVTEERGRAVSKAAISTFIGFGGLALGILLIALGYFDLVI